MYWVNRFESCQAGEGVRARVLDSKWALMNGMSDSSMSPSISVLVTTSLLGIRCKNSYRKKPIDVHNDIGICCTRPVHATGNA